MKSLSTKQLLSVFLTASLILGSCTSYRQVACPEIDQNNYLARTTSRIKTKAPQRTRQTSARNLDKLNANKYDTKTFRSRRDANALTRSPLKQEIRQVSSLEGKIDNPAYPDENLLASADSRSARSGISDRGGEQLKISNVSGASAASGSPEFMSPREFRKFNRKFERELRSSLQVAPRAAGPTTTSKPARGMAIASLALGIISLFFYPGITGTLAIIFGAIAMKRIRADPGQKGKGMAIAGMICGIIGLAYVIVVMAGAGI